MAGARKASSKPVKSLEATLWDAADKLRGNLEASEYKHVVLGLVFLKYVSDAFTARRLELEAALADPGSDDHIPSEARRERILSPATSTPATTSSGSRPAPAGSTCSITPSSPGSASTSTRPWTSSSMRTRA